jgi:hypothetical protein
MVISMTTKVLVKLGKVLSQFVKLFPRYSIGFERRRLLEVVFTVCFPRSKNYSIDFVPPDTIRRIEHSFA